MNKMLLYIILGIGLIYLFTLKSEQKEVLEYHDGSSPNDEFETKRIVKKNVSATAP
jgi:hypothetical protein